MKKIIFIMAAIVGLSLTSCTTTEDTVYMISNTVESYNWTGSLFGEGKQIYEDFSAEIIAWDNKNKSAWQWTTTTKNGKYSKADDEAIAKYQQYLPEIDAIYKKYQAKFDALDEPDYHIEYKALFKLQRIGEQSKDLSSQNFSLKK